jgi:hypothetical protein
MKKLTYVLMVGLTFAATVGLADDPPPPETVVKELVLAAQTNDLEKLIYHADLVEIARGRHARQPHEVVSLLKEVDLAELELDPKDRTTDARAGKTCVNVTAPFLDARFDLELRAVQRMNPHDTLESEYVPVEPHYVVVQIHHHPCAAPIH